MIFLIIHISFFSAKISNEVVYEDDSTMYI